MGWLFNLDISFTGTLFILIGYLLKNIFDRLYSKPSYIILLLGFVCLCSGFLLAQFNAPQNAGLPYWLWLFMEDPIHFLYLCRFSILLPLLFCSILSEKLTLLSWLGEGSLFLMAVHYIIFPYTTTWASHLATGSIAIALCNAVFCTTICIPLLFLTNRYIPILKGK